MINLAFGEIDNYDYYRMNNVSEDEVGSLYEQRIAGLKNYLNRDDVTEAFSEDEKEWLMNKYESLDTPLYYEYAEWLESTAGFSIYSNIDDDYCIDNSILGIGYFF